MRSHHLKHWGITCSIHGNSFSKYLLNQSFIILYVFVLVLRSKYIPFNSNYRLHLILLQVTTFHFKYSSNRNNLNHYILTNSKCVHYSIKLKCVDGFRWMKKAHIHTNKCLRFFSTSYILHRWRIFEKFVAVDVRHLIKIQHWKKTLLMNRKYYVKTMDSFIFQHRHKKKREKKT